MSLIKSSILAIAIGSVIWTGLGPAAIANTLASEEANVVSKSPLAIFPKDVRPAVAYFADYLERIGADAETIAAANLFLSFIEDNGHIISKEISNLTDDESKVLAAGLANGARALKALTLISEKLANQEWLRRVEPALADSILRECNRTFLGGRDMYNVAEQILKDPADFDGEAQNLLDDLGLANNECIENLRVYSAAAGNEVLRLEGFITQKQIELETARISGDNEAAAAIEAEIEKAKEEMRQIEEDGKLLAGLLKLITGIYGVIAGVAGIIASDGTCVPCYGKLAAGFAAVAKGWDEIQGKEGPPIVVGSPARRPGINPDGQPSDEIREAEQKRIQDNPNFSYISPETPGGNYMIAKDEVTGNIVILQILPPRRITVVLQDASPGKLTLPIDRLAEATWTKVITLEVTDTAIRIILIGKLGDQAVKVSFEQNPVDKPFNITVEAQ